MDVDAGGAREVIKDDWPQSQRYLATSGGCGKIGKPLQAIELVARGAVKCFSVLGFIFWGLRSSLLHLTEQFGVHATFGDEEQGGRVGFFLCFLFRLWQRVPGGNAEVWERGVACGVCGSCFCCC